MCNIAGYVGKKNATPILIEMIKAQEGLNGGFYSGLALHNGKGLDYCKLRGDFSKLLSETRAGDLIGNTGIIHSRTPSGGDDAWAHPFFTQIQGETEMCYVANGGYGLYKNKKNEYNAIADALVEGGLDIPCKTENGCEKYNRLASGEYIHMSDVMCQLIYKYKKNGLDTANAMTRAFIEMPSEIVGLVICREDPDKIFFSRINKPMFVGFDSDGAYLASSPTAFPKSVSDYKLLPPLSSGVVCPDRYEIFHYPIFSAKVRGFNKKTVQSATERILLQLKAGECGARDMMRALSARMPKNEILQVDAIVYLALDALLKDGRITQREGCYTVDGQTAPKTYFRLAADREENA